jgi:hypothetical protein
LVAPAALIRGDPEAHLAVAVAAVSAADQKGLVTAGET